MTDDDVMQRRREVALAGHRGDAAAARRAMDDPDAGVRAAALGAVARAGGLTSEELGAALRDPDAGVRRRACELAASGPIGVATAVVGALEDPEVAEMA